MNRVLKLVIAVAVVSVASAATVTAQSASFGLGGGLILPMSDYKNIDKIGWHGLAKVDIGIPMSPVSVRLDALYGQTTHKDIGTTPVDGKTTLIGGLANLVYKIPLPAPMVKPYLLGGAGIYNLKVTVPSASIDTSETKFTWDFGVGASFGAFFVEARYVSIQESGGSTKFIPVTAGFSFGGK